MNATDETRTDTDGKVPDERYVIEQAQTAMATLVKYEAQYNRPPPELQKRIMAFATFIEERLLAIHSRQELAS